MKFLGKFKRSALTLAVLNAGVACTVPAFAAEEEIEKIGFIFYKLFNFYKIKLIFY